MDPVQTVSKPLSDVSGVIIFDSEIPVLEINMSRGLTLGNSALDLTLPGSTGIRLDYELFTIPPGNKPEGVTFTDLIPDSYNQVFYQSFGGITFATEIIATGIPTVPILIRNKEELFAPSNELNPVLNNFTPTNVVYNNTYWYAVGSGASNFIMSPNGMNWSGVETSCKFIDVVHDIAFDRSGMGILVGSKAVGGSQIVALLSNKIFMPVDLGTTTVDTLYSVVFATKWIAVGRDLSGNITILESTNGFIWQEYPTTIPVSSNPKVMYSPLREEYFFYSGINFLVKSINSVNVGSLTGKNYVYIASNSTNFITITEVINASPISYIVEVLEWNGNPISQTTFSTKLISVQWDGTRWILIDSDANQYVSSDGSAWTSRSAFNYPNANGIAFTSSIEKTPGVIAQLEAETFVIDPSVVPSPPQVFEAIPSTLQFQLSEVIGTSGTTGTKMTPARNAWESDGVYNSFEMTFNTDIYSRKSLNFFAGGETYTFKILEADALRPYDIENKYQTDGFYKFIADGIKFSNNMSWSSSYNKIITTMLVCVSIYTELRDILLTDYVSPPSWVDTSMQPYAEFCLSGSRTENSYNIGTFKSIRSLFSIATRDPLTGGGTGNYNLETLGNIIGEVNEENFNAFELNFIYACNTYGIPYVDFTRVMNGFDQVVETAMEGPHQYSFTTSNSRRDFISQINKLFSLEYYASTDYLVDRVVNFAPVVVGFFTDIPSAISSFNLNLQNAVNAVNYARSVSTVDTYTETSLFKVVYDGYTIKLSVDSNIIGEFYVASGPVRIQVISNSVYTPVVSQRIVTLPLTLGFTNLTLQENQDATVLLKNTIKNIRASKISQTTQPSFFNNNEKMSLLGSFTIPSVPNDIDYYSTISQFTSNVSLLGIAGTRLLNANTTMYDALGFSESTYSSTFLTSNFFTKYAAYTDDFNNFMQNTIVFNKLRNDMTTYFNSFSSYTPVYDIRDNHYIIDSYLKSTKLFKKAIVLAYNGSPITYPYAFPPIPGKDLLYNEYTTDLSSIISEHSILENVGGQFYCKQSDIFGSILFDDTANNVGTLEFLNLFKGATGLAVGTYEKIFASFQDEIGVTSIAAAICQQQLSPITFSYKYIQSLNNSTAFPTDSKLLSSVIWDEFYKFKNAVAVDPNEIKSLQYLFANSPGATLTAPYSVSYNGGPQVTIPLLPGEIVPNINMPFFGGSTLPTGTTICIYDASYPGVLTNYYNDNYTNFPSVPGYSTWTPLNNILPQLTQNVSYINAMFDLAKYGYRTPLLDLESYSTSKTLYENLNILPTHANLDSSESGVIFTNIVIPQIREVIEKSVVLDVGNKNKFFTDEQTKFFKDICVVDSNLAGYLNTLVTSTAPLPVKTDVFIDVNSIYLDFAAVYEISVKELLNELISDSVTNITELKTVVTSLINNTYAPLIAFKIQTQSLNDQAQFYINLLPELNKFVERNSIYINLDDSNSRFNRIFSDIASSPPPSGPYYFNPSNDAKNFIVGVCPLDSRWIQLTTIPAGKTIYSYSRYNNVWKYFEGDIVCYRGNLYKLNNTDREYLSQGIPPGGAVNEQRPVGNLQNLTPTLHQIPGEPGRFMIEYVQTNEVPHSNGTEYVPGNPHSLGVQSLLAWEEWHDGPTASPEILAQGYPSNTNYTDNEKIYTLEGNRPDGTPFQIEFYTATYDPKTTYVRGQLVIWGNSVFRCRGGYEVIQGVGVGNPPSYSQEGNSSWVIIGTTGTVDFSNPGSNGVWKSIPGTSDATNRYSNAIYPQYSDTEIYNIGDVVTFDKKLYQRLANGKGKDQTGKIVDIVGLPPPSFNTARGDAEWLAYPYIDLSVEGKDLPKFDPTAYYVTGDIVVYNNLAWKNILNASSARLFAKGYEYSLGDVVIGYGNFLYASLSDYNYTDPPYPRDSRNASLYWKLIGPVDSNTPQSVQEYNFETDYNFLYHYNFGETVRVTYDGNVWEWKHDMGINYADRDVVSLAKIARDYGAVCGVEPPAPEPYNQWILVYPKTNINPYNNETIYKYNPKNYYKKGDIVFYENSYFYCTGNGYGMSTMDNEQVIETQLFIPSKEIEYGNLLYDHNKKVRYLETFVTTSGVNELDISVPKWGPSTEDPWALPGFLRNLRYEFASGLELSYLTLLHDIMLFKEQTNNGAARLTVPTEIADQRILNTSANYLTQQMHNTLVGYTNSNPEDKFKSIEFYYYSEFVKFLNADKVTITRLRAEINAIFDDWVLYHTQQIDQYGANFSDEISTYHYGTYGSLLNNYHMTEQITPSIQGLPIHVKQQKLDPFLEVGTFDARYGDTEKSIKSLMETVDELGLVWLNYFAPPARNVINLYGASGEVIGTTIGFFYTEYCNQTGYPSSPSYDPNIYHFNDDFVTTSRGTTPVSSAVIGYTKAIEVVKQKQESIDLLNTKINAYAGIQTISSIRGVVNIAESAESLYRESVLQRTGFDRIDKDGLVAVFPVYLAIITASDKEYLTLDLEGGWYQKGRGANMIKPNKWYTGKDTVLDRRPGIFTWNERAEEWWTRSYLDTELYSEQRFHEYYLSEPLNFDLKPNIHSFIEVEEAYKKLLTLNNNILVSSPKNNTITAPVTFPNPNLNVWRPLGFIDRNVPSWAVERNWDRWNETHKDGPAEEADKYWNSTRFQQVPKCNLLARLPILSLSPYERWLETAKELWYFQGKKSFVDPDHCRYQSVFQYLLHIKKCSQIEQSTCLPDFVANALKVVGYVQRRNGAQQSFNNKLQSAIIGVLAAVAVINTIIVTVATFGTGTGYTVVLQSLALGAIIAGATAGIMYGISQIPEYGSTIMLFFSDPGALFLPSVDTPQGLATRCSLMDSIASHSARSSRDDLEILENVTPNSQFIPVSSDPVSYQQYRYAKKYYKFLYDTFHSEITNSSGFEFPEIDSGTIEYYADKGISGAALSRQYYETAGRMEDQDTIDYATSIEFCRQVIATYESQLFLPTVIRQEPQSRPAVLQITDFKYITEAAVTDIFATVKIIDPGEGFYSVDRNGRRVPYVKHTILPALSTYETYTLEANGNKVMSGIVLKMKDIRIIGRYLYDDYDIDKTAVKGLATFNHLNIDVYGYAGKVRMEYNYTNTHPVNHFFSIDPPSYASMIRQRSNAQITSSGSTSVGRTSDFGPAKNALFDVELEMRDVRKQLTGTPRGSAEFSTLTKKIDDLKAQSKTLKAANAAGPGTSTVKVSQTTPAGSNALKTVSTTPPSAAPPATSVPEPYKFRSDGGVRVADGRAPVNFDGRSANPTPKPVKVVPPPPPPGPVIVVETIETPPPVRPKPAIIKINLPTPSTLGGLPGPVNPPFIPTPEPIDLPGPRPGPIKTIDIKTPTPYKPPPPPPPPNRPPKPPRPGGLSIRQVTPPIFPPPKPVKIDLSGAIMAAVGIALTIYGAYTQIKSIMSKPPPKTSCTQISTNNKFVL